MDVLFSVVIPTYNHAHFLSHALQSLLDQTYKNWEAIIIDNHSKDNTDEIMRGFADPRITFLKINNNGIIAASRNMGIQKARGEWIAFLDSDDLWYEDKLEICFGHINEMVDVIYHDLRLVREKKKFFSRPVVKGRKLKKNILKDLLINGNAISNSSVVVRKKILDAVGGIDESSEMIASEDYNTWLKISTVTDKFVYIPKIMGGYFCHDASISRKDMYDCMVHASEKFVSCLKEIEIKKYNACLSYARGRFKFLAGEYSSAKEYLLISFKYGNFEIRLKSLFMLVRCNLP